MSVKSMEREIKKSERKGIRINFIFVLQNEE